MSFSYKRSLSDDDDDEDLVVQKSNGSGVNGTKKSKTDEENLSDSDQNLCSSSDSRFTSKNSSASKTASEFGERMLVSIKKFNIIILKILKT